MGRRTFDSLNQRGLPDRKNVVVTHGFGMMSLPKNCRSAHSIEEALVAAEDWRNQKQKVFVVGGASMYEQFAPYVDRYLVTLIQKKVPEADTFFDEADLANPIIWSMKEIGGGKADGVHDEADFEIFEFVKTASDAAHRRTMALENARRRRQGNSLVDNNWALRAAG